MIFSILLWHTLEFDATVGQTYNAEYLMIKVKSTMSGTGVARDMT
jgi:hypothetical protein